jgi:hypothetical protein
VSLKDGLLQLLQVQEVDIELRSLEEAKSQYPTEISQRKRLLGKTCCVFI